MTDLLITGGAGFIGSNFVRYWRQQYPADRMVVLDALTYAGNQANIADLVDGTGLVFVQGDIRDEPLVYDLLRQYAVGAIVHFAAESHVDRSIGGPDAFIDSNINGTHTLLKVARRAWLQERLVPAHRFHHISTDEVFGSLGESEPAFHELTRYAPNSPYAASKAGSDFLVRAYAHTYGLNVTVTNCSNNYGPYQFPEKLIPLCILNCLRGRPLPIYGDGQNVRDWLHVADHCRAIDLVLKNGAPGEFFNVGGENEVRNLELVGTLCACVDAAFRADPSLAGRFPDAPPARSAASQELIRFVDDRLGHDQRYAIDMARLKRQLGFRLSVDWRAGLDETVHWYLANQSWWEPLLQRTAQ